MVLTTVQVNLSDKEKMYSLGELVTTNKPLTEVDAISVEDLDDTRAGGLLPPSNGSSPWCTLNVSTPWILVTSTVIGPILSLLPLACKSF